MQIVKKLARQQNVGVVFKKTVATKRSFDEILANEPKIIHISCHGLIEAKSKSKVMTTDKNNDVIESLLFEDAAECEVSSSEFLG